MLRDQSKQILLVQKAHGAPRRVSRPLPVADMIGVSAWWRGAGGWCVRSGGSSIIGPSRVCGPCWPAGPRRCSAHASTGSSAVSVGHPCGYQLFFSCTHASRAKNCFYALTDRERHVQTHTQAYRSDTRGTREAARRRVVLRRQQRAERPRTGRRAAQRPCRRGSRAGGTRAGRGGTQRTIRGGRRVTAATTGRRGDVDGSAL